MNLDVTPHSYLNIFSWMKEKINASKNGEKLTGFQINEYSNIIANDSFLKNLIDNYLPYSYQWSRLISYSLERTATRTNNSLDIKKMDDTISNELNDSLVRWFIKKYTKNSSAPHKILLEKLTVDFLKKVSLVAYHGRCDHLLKPEAEVHKRRIAANSLLSFSRDINEIAQEEENALQELYNARESFCAYIDELQKAVYVSDIGQLELFLLREWVNGPLSNQKKLLKSEEQRLFIILEAFYSAYSLYTSSQVPLGANTILKDLRNAIIFRMSLIKQAEQASHSQSPEVFVEPVVRLLIDPFIVSHPETRHLLPSNTLYQFYRQALQTIQTTHERKTPEFYTEIVTRMGELIGFGPEHVETLLGLLGQTIDSTMRQLHNLDVLECYDELSLESLPYSCPAMTQQEHQEWLQAAKSKYLEVLNLPYSKTKAWISFWPVFEPLPQFMIDRLIHGINTESWDFSPSVLIRLLKNRDIVLTTESLKNSVLYKLLSQKEVLVDRQLIEMFSDFLDSKYAQQHPLNTDRNPFLNRALSENQFHFISDAISRYHIAQSQGLNWDDVDCSNCLDSLELSVMGCHFDTVKNIAEICFSKPLPEKSEHKILNIFGKAIVREKLDVLRELIAQYNKHESLSQNRVLLSTLFAAAKFGKFHISKYLIENILSPADLIKTAPNQKNLLVFAIEGGSAELVNYLLNEYSALFPLSDQIGYSQETPLQVASNLGKIEILKLILKKIDDPKICYIKNFLGLTALESAVCANKPESVKCLLDFQFPRPSQDLHSYEQNAFASAISCGFEDVANVFFDKFKGRALLRTKHGVPLLTKNTQPLFVAAVSRVLKFYDYCSNILQKLIEVDSSKIQFQTIDHKRKENCFMAAVSLGSEETFCYLVKNYGCFLNDQHKGFKRKTIYEYDLSLNQKQCLRQFHDKKKLKQEIEKTDLRALLSSPETRLFRRNTEQNITKKPRLL